MEITGLILAGGMSSRFGSDKAQALYHGRTFITLAYELLKEVCSDVVISGWTHCLPFENVLCLEDITPGGGPMSGIATAVRKLPCAWLLIIPCDMPLLSRDILEDTLQVAQEREKTVVWQWPDGKIQPFPMLLNRLDAAKAIDLLGTGGGMSVKSMLRSIPYITLPIPSQKESLFRNINTKSEFENL